MVSTRKRKADEAGVAEEDAPTTKATTSKKTAAKDIPEEPSAAGAETSEAQATPTESDSTPAPASNDRAARFAALKARAKSSADSNLSAARHEASRQAIDPSQLAALSRRQAIATHKLLKAESDTPEEFERKRAWDWTIDESEKWDKRMSKKEKHRDDVGFRNYGDEAGKVYRRQVREMNKEDGKRSKHGAGEGQDAGDGDSDSRLTAYEQAKIQTLLNAAQSGGLEIVEEDGSGELVLLDRHGTYAGNAGNTSTEHINQKPSKDNVDKLVADLNKAEETRLRKIKQRKGASDDIDAAGDVTFINDKNKTFNQKLRRFYDKYTKDIRDSFERGTAI